MFDKVHVLHLRLRKLSYLFFTCLKYHTLYTHLYKFSCCVLFIEDYSICVRIGKVLYTLRIKLV